VFFDMSPTYVSIYSCLKNEHVTDLVQVVSKEKEKSMLTFNPFFYIF